MVHGWYASAHPNVLTVSVLSRLGWVNEWCSLAKHFMLAVPFSTQECKLSGKSEFLVVGGGVVSYLGGVVILLAKRDESRVSNIDFTLPANPPERRVGVWPIIPFLSFQLFICPLFPIYFLD